MLSLKVDGRLFKYYSETAFKELEVRFNLSSSHLSAHLSNKESLKVRLTIISFKTTLKYL